MLLYYHTSLLALELINFEFDLKAFILVKNTDKYEQNKYYQIRTSVLFSMLKYKILYGLLLVIVCIMFVSKL